MRQESERPDSCTARYRITQEWVSGLGIAPSRLVRGAIALVPTIVVAAVRNRRLRWREIAQMIRLDALRRVLHRAKSRQHRIILLDEGPVFSISWLDLAFAKRGAHGH